MAIALNMFVGKNAENRIVTIAVGAIAGIIVLVGLFFAMWGIVGAFTKGPVGTLFPAMVGLLLNGFLVYLVIYGIQFASRAAAKRRAYVSEQTIDWTPAAGSGRFARVLDPRRSELL